MPPAARVSDMHVCPMVTGVVPHVGGPILPPCAITVITVGMPQARMGDMAFCVGPPDVIAKGSAGVYVMGSPAARMGDITVHGGVIALGAPTVIIGEIGMATVSPGDMSVVLPIMLPMGAEGRGDPDVPAMVKTMIAACTDGKPFCEQCQKAMQGQGQG